MDDLNLFEEIVVWCEIDEDSFNRYRCLKNLKTGKYSVFGVSHIQKNNFDDIEIQQHQEFAFRQGLFAFGLNKLDESEIFDSIEEAISDYESE